MNTLFAGRMAFLCAFCDKTSAETSSVTAFEAVFLGVLAMTLIYAVTVFLPKIAAAVDRLMGKKQEEFPECDAEPSPARVEDNYKVYDIYEGELNLDDNDKKE